MPNDMRLLMRSVINTSAQCGAEGNKMYVVIIEESKTTFESGTTAFDRVVYVGEAAAHPTGVTYEVYTTITIRHVGSYQSREEAQDVAATME